VLNIDIVDYPGEWLLDLPLLDLTYEAWSANMLRLTEREPRRRLADQWLAAVASAKPAGRRMNRRSAASPRSTAIISRPRPSPPLVSP
jgi:predicted YcjX-like family ATPase